MMPKWDRSSGSGMGVSCMMNFRCEDLVYAMLGYRAWDLKTIQQDSRMGNYADDKKFDEKWGYESWYWDLHDGLLELLLDIFLVVFASMV